MRGAAMAAAVLLAACQVQTDGARCDANANCPSGQACGNDRTCSARAAACADRCAPGASRCAAGGAVERCTVDDPVCGAWIPDACEAGLACGTRAGAPACECLPADGALLVADPAGSAPGAPPYATGRADAPARCRFAKLGDALAAAAGGKRVSARNGPFGDATGEVFPLDVAPGVTVEGEGASGVRIETAAVVQSTMLLLREGATLRRVTLSNEVIPPPGAPPVTPSAAVALACDGATTSPPPAAAIEEVSIETDALTRGIAITCPAALTNVRVSGALGPALYVNSPDPAYEVSVVGGRFGESTTGVEVRGGVVRLAAPDGATLEVADNAEHGIVAIGGSRAIVLQVEHAHIAGNGGTGVRTDQLPAGSSVSINACEISGNKASVAGSQYDTGRKAGGVIVKQVGTPTFAFTSNVVECNGGDQVGLYVGTDPMHIGGGGCDASSNLFRTTKTGTAINASQYATVVATGNTWAPDPPNVPANVSWDPTCSAIPAPPLCD